jgi:hypothetical protein
MARIYTVMVCLGCLLFLQFFLLTVALEGYLSGRGTVAPPAALASGLCCIIACWLMRYLLVPERR